MKIRIVKKPPSVFEGISLSLYRVDGVYEITSALANYLVAEGFAVIELRNDRPSPEPSVDRRKKR